MVKQKQQETTFIKFIKDIKDWLAELFFPQFCLGCHRQNTYLCQDCLALIDLCDRVFLINQELSLLYSGADYQHFLVKKLIHQCKYKPFAKELSQTLAFLIILYFTNLENKPEFFTDEQNQKDFLLIPVPLFKKRLKWRGFNQAELIARHLSDFLKIPLAVDCLIKTRTTQLQAELTSQEREINLKDVFECLRPETVKDKRILLVDDVYTTGATMNQAAKVLKKAGAKQVDGLVVARG